MTWFSSLVRTEWEEFARSRIEVREQELVDHQGGNGKTRHHFHPLLDCVWAPCWTSHSNGTMRFLGDFLLFPSLTASVLGVGISALENSHFNEKALIIVPSLSYVNTGRNKKKWRKANQAPEYCGNRAYNGIQWLGSFKEGFLEEKTIDGDPTWRSTLLKSLQANEGEPCE